MNLARVKARPFVTITTLLAIGIAWWTLAIGGCDTRANREEVSQHADDLAAEIKLARDAEERDAAMAKLIDILHSRWVFAQCRAAYSLGTLGEMAQPAIPDLMQAANSSNRFVEGAAVRALGSIGPTAAPAVDLLMSKLEDGVSGQLIKSVAWYAARALGEIGEPALKAIPLLERASRSPHEFLAQESIEALQKLKKQTVSEAADAKASPAPKAIPLD